jgi:acetylornithine deacetylase/succinyl-diaminopimelate desuccinylase-like protein
MNKPLDPQQILTQARARLPEMTALLQELVRIPSVNARDPETAVAERITAAARRLGLDAELTGTQTGRQNALVQWGSGASGFAIIGHIDTVSEGAADAWASPPFAAHIRDGNLYGRGAADNKAGIVCGLYTLALLRDSGLLDPTRVRLMVAGVVDEESGASSPLGVRYLLDQGKLASALGAIYAYTSDIICIGHRGLLRLLLRAEGQSTHTGSPAWSRGEGGVNAVTGLAAVLLRLEALRLPAPHHPAFAGMGCQITPGTLFHGGEFESMVPARAQALVDVRLMPGQAAQGVLAALQSAIDAEIALRPGLRISVEIKNNLPGVALEPDHALVQAARTWTRQITGQEWAAAGAGPANEGYMLMQAGIPTLCGFGPTGGNAHAPDEWVELDSLARTVAMFAGIITTIVQP